MATYYPYTRQFCLAAFCVAAHGYVWYCVTGHMQGSIWRTWPAYGPAYGLAYGPTYGPAGHQTMHPTLTTGEHFWRKSMHLLHKSFVRGVQAWPPAEIPHPKCAF